MTLHFDSRDLFRCVRLGWSGKKIWIGFLGLLLSWGGYSALILAAHWRHGTSMSFLWHEYGVFLGAKMGAFGLLGTVLHIVGMVWVVAVVLVAMSMICKITFQQLRGDGFYSSGDAWAFAKTHWTGVLFGPLGALALFVFFVVVGMVIGLVAGWVPVVGELFFALGFVPIFLAALLAVFMMFVFVISLAMSPAIVGTVGEDALEVVIQSFSLLWNQPWRMVLYLACVKVASWIGVFVLSTMSMMALWLITWACGLFMESKLANLFDIGTRYMPFIPEQWDVVLGNLPAPVELGGAEVWSGRILGVMLIFITGILISYGLAAQASGCTLIYVILRRCKDGENMLEWDTPDWGHVDMVDESAEADQAPNGEHQDEHAPITEDDSDSTSTEKT